MKFTDKNIRPKPLKPRLDSVPTELKECRQWILWKYVWKETESVWAKVPFQVNGNHAKTNDPTTWSSFEACFMAYDQKQSLYDGIGFVFPPIRNSSALTLTAASQKLAGKTN